MSGVIRWEDPPPVAHRRGERKVPWSLIAEQLRERPGAWAVVMEANRDSMLCRRIKQGISPWFAPAGSFDAAQRLNDQGVSVLYVRYIGEPS